MAWFEYVGYVAATCTTGAYVPQVMKVWKTRHTGDISLKAYSALVTGLGLWLTYGFLKGDWPLVAANSITLCLAGTILWFKVHETRRQQDPADEEARADQGGSGRVSAKLQAGQ